MEEISVMISNQRNLLTTLNRMSLRFTQKNSSDFTRRYLDTLAQELDSMFQQFKYQHEEICNAIRDSSISDRDVPYIEEECFFDYQEQYMIFKGKFLDSIQQTDTNRFPLSSTFAVAHNHSELNSSMEVKLPKISLPKFSGEYTDWVPYRDIYMSMVHDKLSIPKIQKFYYLKSSLSGEAAALIKTISVTESNYDSAWEILESRYHNKRIIVGTLINKFFNIPKSDGTFQSVKTLLDTTQECLYSLKNLNIDTTTWDPIIINLICQKLDQQTRKDWEQSLKSSTEIPSRSEMFSFLERTFRTLESLNESSRSNKILKPFSKDTKFKNNKKTFVNTASTSQSKSFSCLYCGGNHYTSKCYKFLALPLNARLDYVSNKKLCKNCLSSGHAYTNCSSHFRCTVCKKAHHTVLHSDESISAQNALMTDASSDSLDVAQDLQITSHNSNSFQNVVLYTIRLYVYSNRGQFPLRALLDPGSQGSLISESAVQLLGLQKHKSHCKVVGIGKDNGTFSKYSVNIDLWSRKQEPILSCSALVLPSISSYSPSPSSEKLSMPNLEPDSLADPFYFKTDPIDLILGSDICSQIKIPTDSFVHNNLFFQNTCFGWVFSGSSNNNPSHIVHFHNVNLEQILRKFWEQEELVEKRDMTGEEIACESYFKSTTKRTSKGRYMVNLPFKSALVAKTVPKIHNNTINALNRLKQLEVSFSKRTLFAETYKAFMLEYESLGHMSKIGTYPKDVSNNTYFLPHHGVFKESTTTKLRVVFDGSSHMEGQNSFNEELSPGPALQNDLTQILTKWRKHKYAFSADIEKMFRQILVCPEHRPFQQILWRSNPLNEICIFQLNTVTYGTTSAPYLSIRVLQQIADDYKLEFPNECKVLVTDSYVDDIISGADTLENVKTLQKNLCVLLEKSGCNLRKWITNSKELLNEIPEEFREKSINLNFDQDNIVKTLGIQWNTTTDSFFFKVNIDENRVITKRTILSETARLYDPLGWLTPCTVVAKYIFKQLWENGLEWDSKLPPEIEQKWTKYRSNLKNFSNLKIPRWINFDKNSRIELHCFGDASTKAYASVVYVRIINSNGIFVNLLQAKSKVSPIKTVSIPRLELCAAALLVKLSQKVMKSFSDLIIENIYYWSDSSTVLSWIRKPPSRWTVYVANRVAEIQRLSSPIQWRYVPSNLNPADCASRGIFPQELMGCKTWWFGPEFLYKSQSLWPKNIPMLETTEEQRKTKISTNIATDILYPDFISKFSKLYKLLRIITLCRRFIDNCKNPSFKKLGTLTSANLNNTLHTLVKVTQNIEFSNEFKMLISKGEVKHKPLLKLMPFIDKEGIIRVGGRLQNSNLPNDVKHPILLAKTNPLSKLIICDSHEKTLHGGLTLTMSYVNRKFWILSGNQLAKKIIYSCMRCFKYSAKTSGQIMGNLPSVRLNVTRPFKHSGVDYAGPISIKSSKLRSTVVSKGYICLFICMVTKAIHLEAVSDLTTNSFLAAFRRFISRRGLCTDMYSDCGTNFVGASKELRILIHNSHKSLPEDVRTKLSSIGTKWHFIPPASPNFGGLWEAGVKSVKYHLKRIMNDKILNFEELSTLLCQIESCLNSRPLCPLSTDPSDLDALTPAHFIIGEPTNCYPEESLLDKNVNHLSRWKSIQKLKQHFWKRWYMEYLNRLQARPKWVNSKPDAKVGDLILIADDRCGPGQWNLGRIVQVHPGCDNRVRVVTVLTKGKLMKRPISKICFLPTDTSPANDSTKDCQKEVMEPHAAEL